MRHKRTLILVSLVVVLAFTAGGVGAQIERGSKIIERLTGQTQGGWVKTDKTPGTPGHERVYCIKIDSALSCDWGDVRPIRADSRISRR